MIRRLTDLPDPAPALADLESVFFLSSARRRFDTPADRARFFETWTGWHRRAAPGDILLWMEGGRALGYLTGCRDSAGAAELFDTVPDYALFADLFDRFPAHLHVNVHPDARGRGIGARLVEAFAADCGTGLHVVTAAGARNAAFYARCGFTHAVERKGLLFLGRNA